MNGPGCFPHFPQEPEIRGGNASYQRWAIFDSPATLG